MLKILSIAVAVLLLAPDGSCAAAGSDGADVALSWRTVLEPGGSKPGNLLVLGREHTPAAFEKWMGEEFVPA